MLFKDGVRSLTFQPRFEEREIVAFLDVIHRGRTLSAEDSDDLLTLLWEKDFQYLHYMFQDLTADTGIKELPSEEEIEPAQTNPQFVQQTIQEDASPRNLEGLVRAEDFDTTLYFLDESEIETLKRYVQEEYTQDLRRNVLAMLFDIMELQPFPTVRTELIGILESFLPYLLGAGDYGATAYVLREVKVVLARARDVLPEQREALEKLPARLSEAGTLGQLVQTLDEGVTAVNPAELAELFSELRPDALPTLFSWLPRLRNPQIQAIVEAAVERLATANLPTVVEALQSGDVNVVLTAMRLAAKLRIQQAVTPLAGLFGHAEPAVRVALVQALADIATPSAIQALERGLDDADREVRLASLRVIAQHKSKSALPRITNVVQGKSVRQADLTEKMVFFEAYGMLAGEGAIEYLNGLLSSGGFLKKKVDPQTRACAAMALGKIGTPRARECLEKAREDKEPLVRNAVLRALRGERGSALFKTSDLNL
ncbi:MAG TPA: HEAT repeat domain-containing protein [Gemmatimonadales bacterium]|nr:HEAT repeat domain-containing protein [Gemmatimonadales bacterium]